MCEFWQLKLEHNKHRDKKTDEALFNLGWTPLRVWEHEIKESTDAVVNQIRSLLAC